MTKPTKVAKVPVIMQMEALECGAACLAMILAYYGKWLPLEQVRRDSGVSRDGSNARDLLLAARNYNMNAKILRAEPDQLRQADVFPCIIHWNFNHFVVLNGFSRGKAVINDPARGLVSIPEEEFDRSFTGILNWSEMPITTPPFAVPSNFVTANAFTSVALVNCLACS